VETGPEGYIALTSSKIFLISVLACLTLASVAPSICKNNFLSPGPGCLPCGKY